MGDDEYYRILGLTKSATDKDIKSAYRKLALKYHPDRNPDDAKAEEMFKKVSEAYDVLSNEKSRKEYDMYGKEGPKMGGGGFGGGMPHNDPMNIFRAFMGEGGGGGDPFMFGGGSGGDPFGFGGGFGGGFQRQRRQKPQEMVKDKAIDQTLNVSLEDILTGTTKKMRITRKVYGDRGLLREEEEILHIPVRKGWKSGTKLTFEKKGDVRPGHIPADIVFTLAIRDHPVFFRLGGLSGSAFGHMGRASHNDLGMTLSISLAEALTGGSRKNLAMLDGSSRDVAWGPLRDLDDNVLRLPQCGLPDKSSGERGALYIRFNITIPSSLSQGDRKKIADMISK